MLAGHGLNFRHDDWELMQDRYRGGVSSFLEPLNEHLSIVPIAVYRILFHTVGLASYAWFRLVLTALDLACAYCVWVLVRCRVSSSLAIGLTAVLVFCGAAFENFIFPIEIGQVSSLLGGLVAWVILDRSPRWGTAGVIAAVAFSLASSAIGVAVLAGVGIELLLRRQRGRLIGLTALAVLFGAWYLGYGHGNAFFDISRVPSFLAGIAAYTIAGTLGLWPLYHLSHGLLIAAALVLSVFVVCLLLVLRRRGWLSRSLPSAANASFPRVAGLVTMLAVYWALASVARAGLTPYRSRYMHPGAIVLVLLAAELLRGRRLAPRATSAILATCAASVVLGVPYLVHNATKYREESSILSAQVGALEIARADAPAHFEPAPENDPQIQAGPLFKVELALNSSPGDSPALIARQPAPSRTAADRVLLRLSPSLVTMIAPGQMKACPRPQARTLAASGTAVSPGESVVVRNASDVPARIGLARFSATPIWLSSSLAGRAVAQIETERDAFGPPWRLYSSNQGQVLICNRTSP